MANKTTGKLPNGKRSSSAMSKLITQAKREELKIAKHKAAILKKQGLLSKNYNVRGMKTVTRYLKDKISEYSGVINGDLKAVKLRAKTPTGGLTTVKVGRKKIALVNIAGKKQPKVFVTNNAVTVIDSIFGTHIMETVISVSAGELFDMDADSRAKVFGEYHLTKNQSFVAYLGKEDFITRESFASVGSLIEYLARYRSDSNSEFDSVAVTIRVQNDDDISTYRKAQRVATDERARERERDRKRNMTPAQRERVNARRRANYAKSKGAQ